jgi:hypothetical protein
MQVARFRQLEYGTRVGSRYRLRLALFDSSDRDFYELRKHRKVWHCGR